MNAYINCQGHLVSLVLLQASGNQAVISGETLTRFLSTKGYYVPRQWDVYWANRQVFLDSFFFFFFSNYLTTNVLLSVTPPTPLHMICAGLCCLTSFIGSLMERLLKGPAIALQFEAPPAS